MIGPTVVNVPRKKARQFFGCDEETDREVAARWHREDRLCNEYYGVYVMEEEHFEGQHQDNVEKFLNTIAHKTRIMHEKDKRLIDYVL